MTKEVNLSTGSAAEESAAVTRPDYENEIVSIVRGNLSPLVMQEKLEDYLKAPQELMVQHKIVRMLLLQKQERQ